MSSGARMMRMAVLLRRMRGPLPARARWFLVSLLLLAVSGTILHYRLQAHVQQQARQMVDRWLASAGGKAGRVRYQLLLGDISIQNVRLARAGMALHVGLIRLHAPLSALGAGRMVFSDVHIKGLTVSFQSLQGRDVFGAATQQRVLAALKLLRMTRRVHVDGLLLRAHAADGRLFVATGRLRLDHAEPGRRLRLHLEMAGGGLDVAGAWQWDERGKARMQTDWAWWHIETGPVLVQLGLARWLRAASDGRLSWQADWSDGVHRLAGRLLLSGLAVRRDGETQGSRPGIDFNIAARAGQITARLDCKAVPLVDVRSLTLGGRYLAGATFSGRLMAEGSNPAAGRWRYTADGGLTNATYVAPGLPSWRLPQVELAGLKLKLPERQLRIRKLLARDADVAFRLWDADDDAGPAPGWRLAIETFSLERLHVRLQPADGGAFLHLRGLHGTGRLRAGGGITLDLRGAREDGQRWQVRGQGSLTGGTFAADVEADKVPLVQLRPLLPDLSWLGLGKAPELGADVSMKLRVQHDAKGTYAGGSVRADSVLLAHAGTRIQADRLWLDVARAGAGLMHISRIRADGWHYQAPLLPMDAASAPPPLSGGRRHQWKMDDIVLNNGVISFGSDSGWMRDVRVRVHGLDAGNEAPVSVQARLGEGTFQLSGNVDMFSPVRHFAVRARLRHALPFFLGDWFAVSGAPRITRGRLNADLRLKSTGTNGGYRGVLYLGLYHGQLEPGVFPDDALLKLVGYSTQSIFNRLRTIRRWWIKVPLAGEARTLGFATLGRQLLAAIRQQMKQAHGAAPLVPEEQLIALEHIRLHDDKPLSLNERIRLRRMLKRLKDQRGFVIDLQPQLGGEPLDASMTARIRHTQAMIERFLRRQGVATMRIFPVWPQARQRTGEVGGILIRVLAS